MPQVAVQRTFWAALAVAALIMAIFAAMLWRSRQELRDEIRLKMIERDAAVLHPVALQQIESEAETRPGLPVEITLSGLLRHAHREGLFAMAIFDPEGVPMESVPASQGFVELPVEDFFRLVEEGPISRYHPAFPLDRLIPTISESEKVVPVLEILLPLRRRGKGPRLGFVRYHLDGRPLARELALIDARLNRHLFVMMGVGFSLIAAVVAIAASRIARSQRALSERNERLSRANFELSLSAKASALGQITSHLIHGLQGPVAGLRAAVAGRAPTDWADAAAYTERLETLIRETVEMLGDTRAHLSYELSGVELADTILRRGQSHAQERGVTVKVVTDVSRTLDSHRGGLLCLIAANLVHNAIDASDRGSAVAVSLKESHEQWELTVADQGSGIPDDIRRRLFEPGRTSKPTGTGLGLAISHLLARQIGGELQLVATGLSGTTFTLSIPHPSMAA